MAADRRERWLVVAALVVPPLLQPHLLGSSFFLNAGVNAAFAAAAAIRAYARRELLGWRWVVFPGLVAVMYLTGIAIHALVELPGGGEVIVPRY